MRAYWTWARLTVDDKRPDRFSLRWCNDGAGAISDMGADWVAVWRP